MKKIDEKRSPVRSAAAERAQRLAEELRANLRKRKEKARSTGTPREPVEGGRPADGTAD